MRIITSIYIDDITIASSSAAESDRIMQVLFKRFKLRDLGPISFLLGIQIARDRSNRCITLSQRQFILNMLDRYSFSNCAPVKTDMEPELYGA